MDRLRVIVATGDEILEPVIGSMQQVELVASLYLAQDVQRFFEMKTADVIIITDYFDPQLELVKELRLQEESLHILFINTKGDIEGEAINKLLVSMGVYSILPATFTREELETAILEPKQWHSLLRDTMVSPQSTSQPENSEPAPPKIVTEIKTEVKLWRQKAVCIWSPKGGVGKSFVAANLSLMLARAGLRVALFDGDFVSQSLATYFDLGARNRGLIYAVKAKDKAEFLERLCYHPKYKELAVLTASDHCRPEAYVNIDGAALDQVFLWLRQEFDVLVFDTGVALDHVSTFTCLKQADQIVLLCDDDYSTVWSLRRHGKLMERLGFDLKTCTYLLNKIKQDSKLKPKIIEEMLEVKTLAKISFHNKVVDCTFEGQNLVEIEEDWAAGVKLGFYELGSHLCPKISKPQKHRFYIGKLFGLGG